MDTIQEKDIAPASIGTVGEEPEILLLATGSEIAITLEAARQLAGEGIRVRVVSIPCWELFDEQPADYRETVLPRRIEKRLAVEAASPMGWHKYVGLDGEIHALDHFGASAPAKDLAREFGFTADKVAERARRMLGRG